MKLTVRAANQWYRQPFGMVNEVIGKTALDAQVTVVGGGSGWWSGDLDDFTPSLISFRIDIEIDLAADPTEVTGSASFFELSFRFGAT